MNNPMFIAVVLVVFANPYCAVSQESLPFRVRLSGGVSKCVSLEEEPIGPSFSVKLQKNFSPSFGLSLGLQSDRIANMAVPRETGTLGLFGISIGYDADSITSLSWYGLLGGGVAFGVGYRTKGAAHLTSGLAVPLIESTAIFFEGSVLFISLSSGWLPGEVYVLLRLGAKLTL